MKTPQEVLDEARTRFYEAVSLFQADPLNDEAYNRLEVRMLELQDAMRALKDAEEAKHEGR